MSPTNNRFLREEYAARINRVMDYIDANIDAELSLDALARVARFSPYHFHRIFRALIGEPLFQFIQRIRLEKAAAQLIANPKKPITRIALDCGFSGSAAFARAFREAFGMSASAWRASGGDLRNPGKPNSKQGKTSRNEGKDSHAFSVYDTPITTTRRKCMNKRVSTNVEVKELPETTVAYVRNVGPFKGNSALFGSLIGKLCAWAGPRGHLGPDTRIMAVYHDNPDITKEQKLRLSVCLPVSPNASVDGEIGMMTIAGGRYAVARFELAENEYEAAWNAVYGEWLPSSGYQPDDRPPFEIYHNDPTTHPQGLCVVDICVPVMPL
ncbi:MAG TPA: AraC family transcriptional regulator [Spirochaetota bacterium]|nr:AraC family transcriptional regulator [Spirochaetota bacterium]HNT10129.1 AraC family transcriptional regulator [Spirochaetota bacterium]